MKKMKKKGQLWISAALYIALGIILVSLILSVGLPFINKIKDRNTVVQTKNVMYSFDKLIREVYMEGLGSRRPILVDIKAGEFIVDNENDKLNWKFISENRIGIEPGIVIQEGNLNMESEKLGQGYEIDMWLEFDTIDIEASDNVMTLSGTYNLVVEHSENSVIVIREAG